MFDYIFSQPNDRTINFNENESNNLCGCLMVQYGRDNFSDRSFDACGCQYWTKLEDCTLPYAGSKIVAELNYPFNFFTPRCTGLVTYKELKEHIRVKHNAVPSSVPTTTA